jgi:hypothetical protein
MGLRDWISPNHIDVHVGLSEVRFVADEERVAVPAVLHLAVPHGRRSRGIGRLLTGVGDTAPPASTDFSLRLFENDACPSDIAAQKDEYLVAFFRFCLELLIRNKLFRVKPIVRVTVAEEVVLATAGYSHALLRHALLQSGARQVEIV